MIPLLTDWTDLPNSLRGGCVAVGNFDGVHQGHALLVRTLVDQARRVGSPAVVLTFDPPPIVLLKPEVPFLPPITTLRRRAELLGQLGVDALFALPTSHELLNLSAHQFFHDVLLTRLAARGIVEGPNFYFGKDRQGNTQVLAELCAKQQITLTIVEAQTNEKGMISSSRIRQLLGSGEIEIANQMLTRPFRISGRVGKGAGRGKKILVPTANLTQIESLIPAHGVYGGMVELDGKFYRAAVNIGPNPTFSDSSPKVEIHILQWQGELYEKPLSCDLITRIRTIKKFESIEELLSEIQSDIQKIANRISLPTSA